MTRTDHDSPQLGGFEGRLLDALTALDERRQVASPMAASLPRRRRVRRPVVLGSVVVAGVAIGGAAVAGIITSPPTLQSGSGESVAAGGEVTLKGSGCAPASDVDLVFDDGPVLGRSTADAEGLFIGTVTIPVNTSPGRHAISAACPGGDGKQLVQRLSLTVSAVEERVPLEPTLSVGGAAAPGGVAFAKGAGCRPGSEVGVTLDAGASVTTIAGRDGQFLAELDVPADARLGQHKVTATCTRGDGNILTQTDTLTVVPAEPQPAETKPVR